MDFIESPRFPDDVSYGSSGGPTFSTTVVGSAGGHEQRNINWVQARAKYNASLGVRSQQQLDDVLTVYRSVYGRAIGLRYKDWADYRCSQAQGVLVDRGLGDGSYQMYKRYAFGDAIYMRIITKPVVGAIVLHDGSGALDYTTGIVADCLATSWSGEFDVPVRFDSDELLATADSFDSFSTAIDLIEIRMDGEPVAISPSLIP